MDTEKRQADGEAMTFDEILADKAYQSEFDRRVTKALETAREKWETTELNPTRDMLKQANEKIESYKSMDIDGIKKSAEDWKQKAEQAERDAKARIEALRFDNTLNESLLAAKARNPKAVAALLNRDALKLTDDGIIGLREQIESIRKDNAFLFADMADPRGGATLKAPPPTTSSMNDFIRGKGE